MSSLRTIAACMIGLVPMAGVTAPAEPLRTFASCAGRLSAEMEHQWLMSDPASDRTEVQRAAMLSLIEAISDPSQDGTVLSWRIAAKQAHATLLRRATFNADQGDAAWALTRAKAELAQCTGLLLS